jgi:hypothetical protein
LKTAAYLDDIEEAIYPAGTAALIRGTVMVGWLGLDRIEYWLRQVIRPVGELHEDDPAWATSEWRPCDLVLPPADLASELPLGVNLARIWGVRPDGRPKGWPMRFSVAPWSVLLEELKPGDYEFRARTVDANGFAQSEPRKFSQGSGRNGVQCKPLPITGKP